MAQNMDSPMGPNQALAYRARMFELKQIAEQVARSIGDLELIAAAYGRTPTAQDGADAEEISKQLLDIGMFIDIRHSDIENA